MVCLLKNINEKQDPKEKKKSKASWYSSGLMLTITLDEF